MYYPNLHYRFCKRDTVSYYLMFFDDNQVNYFLGEEGLAEIFGKDNRSSLSIMQELESAEKGALEVGLRSQPVVGPADPTR